MVLPRGTVGMIDASITRMPSKPRNLPDVSVTASRSFGVRAHTAGADRMEHAGDIGAGCARPARHRPGPASADRPCGRRASRNRPGERRHQVDELGDDRALDLVLGVEPVELPQPVVELHRERYAAHRPHLSCASISTARRKPCMKRWRSSSWPQKLNSTSGSAAIRRLQRHAAARHRLEQRRREVGDLQARAGSRTSCICTLMYMSVRGAPGSPEE